MPFKNKRQLTIFTSIIFVFITIISLSIYYINQPRVIFTQTKIQLEAGSEFDSEQYIKKIKNATKKDLTIDTSTLDLNHVGKYKVSYKVKGKSYRLLCEVIDTTAPTFDVIEETTDVGIPLKAEQFVQNVHDYSPYKIRFKDPVGFNKEGKQELSIIVSDHSNNETIKKTCVHILPKDQIPPTIQLIEKVIVDIDSIYNPLDYIEISDNQDNNVTIDIDSSHVNTTLEGTYDITIHATDRSHNKTTAKQQVIVKDITPIGHDSSSDENIVYLTFDDGPSKNTGPILDILKKYNVKATFFVTKSGEYYPEFIQRAHREGHTIGLHTYAHNYENIYQSTIAYFNDLNQVDQMVYDLIGVHSPYIRFPGGSSNTISEQYKDGIMTRLSELVQAQGYQYYDWNISSGDASGSNVPVDEIIKQSTQEDSGNLNILFHDAGTKETTVEALPKIIEYYQSLGFTFKSIDKDSYTCHHRIHN